MDAGQVISRLSVGVSRQAQTALLIVTSILASPSVPNSLAALAEFVDVTVVAIIVYQSTVSSPILGLQLSWLVIGCLVAIHLPNLYPEALSTFAQYKGVRALTGVITVYFGVWIAIVAGFNPPAVALGLISTTGQNITNIMNLFLSGFAVSLVLFTLYFWIIRGERVVSTDSEFATLDIGPGEGTSVEEALSTLSQPVRIVLVVIFAFLFPAILVLPCLLMGVILGFLNGFYPIPELLLLGGIVANYIATHLGPIPIIGEPDVEYSTINAATDSCQNLKGMFLIIICLTGLGISAILYFLMGIPAVLTIFGVWVGGDIGEGIPHALQQIGSAGGLGFVQLVRVTASVWFVIGLGVILIASGIHGLFYWVRQIQRLPRYVSFWEDYWRGQTRRPPEASIARPSGPFLPGLLLLIIFIVMAAVVHLRAHIWSFPPDMPSWSPMVWSLVIGFGFGWPVLLAVVVWNTRCALRGKPQPLNKEGREILIAIALLIGVFTTTSPLITGGSLVDATLLVASVIAMFTLLAYSPDVLYYSKQQKGLGSNLYIIYNIFILVIALIIMEALGSIPASFWILVLIVLSLMVLDPILSR